MKLKQLIRNEMERKDITGKELAKMIGLKGQSTLTKFLDEENREMENFNILLNLVRTLFPDQEREVFMNYFQTVDINKKTARMALEYAESNNDYEMLEMMLDRMKDSDRESKEWYTVYKIRKEIAENKSSIVEAMDLLTGQRIKSVEMKIFSRIILLYKYLSENQFDILKEFLLSVDIEQLQGIKDEFIKNSFLCRVRLIEVNLNARLDLIEKARENAKMVIELSHNNRFKIYANIILGNTYIMENHELAKSFLNESMKLSEDNEIYTKQVKRSLNFNANFWSKNPEHLNFESNDSEDIHEIVYFFINTGRNDEALELLNKINESDMTVNSKGFHYYLRGLILQSKEMFYQSVSYFKKSGDKHFRKLPLIELKKLGENEMVLNALSV